MLKIKLDKNKKYAVVKTKNNKTLLVETHTVDISKPREYKNTLHYSQQLQNAYDNDDTREIQRLEKFFLDLVNVNFHDYVKTTDDYADNYDAYTDYKTYHLINETDHRKQFATRHDLNIKNDELPVNSTQNETEFACKRVELNKLKNAKRRHKRKMKK